MMWTWRQRSAVKMLENFFFFSFFTTYNDFHLPVCFGFGLHPPLSALFYVQLQAFSYRPLSNQICKGCLWISVASICNFSNSNSNTRTILITKLKSFSCGKLRENHHGEENIPNPKELRTYRTQSPCTVNRGRNAAWLRSDTDLSKSNPTYTGEADTNHSEYWKSAVFKAKGPPQRCDWIESISGIKLLRVSSASGLCHTIVPELTFVLCPGIPLHMCSWWVRGTAELPARGVVDILVVVKV